MTFTEIIDKFLAEGTHRNLIPVAEVRPVSARAESPVWVDAAGHRPRRAATTPKGGHCR